MPERAHVRLPRLDRVRIEHLSLYRSTQVIDVDLDAGGVFCLAGANGLGKSTFLSVLNFALTGTVPSPDSKFRSIAAYYRDCVRYATEYFHGRVGPDDRNRASVRLTFGLNGRTYELVRGLFEPEQLRYFSVRDGEGTIVVGDTESPLAEGSDELHDQYVSSLLDDSALSNFGQLVFLQHFLFTFDERRHLLFWDEAVAAQALMLALGVDPERAEMADEWRREAEGQDSQARNAQYDATQARGHLRELRVQLESLGSGRGDGATVDAEALARRHRELQQAADAADEELLASGTALRDAQLELAQAAAKLLQARRGYESAFNSDLLRGRVAATNELVAHVLSDSECRVCGTRGPDVRAAVEGALGRHECPLCTSTLPAETADDDGGSALLEADAEVTRRSSALRAAEEELSRVGERYAGAAEAQRAAADALSEFEIDNELATAAGDSSGLARVEQQYRAVIETSLQRKQMHLERRDALYSQLKPIQAELVTAFQEAQAAFVPVFEQLAYAFLGLPVQVELVASGTSRVRLLLTVQGSRRRGTAELSESQRYFVDVALRMALIDYLAPGNDAALAVDTPEGSLDIAYEARVGEMFDGFVERGHRIIMTANINSSQLLIRLAERRGRAGMRIVRMTDWTTMSDVQVEGEALFDAALLEIDAALARHADGTERSAGVR